MKLIDLLDESLHQALSAYFQNSDFKRRADRVKNLLGDALGKVVPSLKWLLKIFKSNKNLRLTTIETLKCSIGGEIKCRIDTGATICSIDAKNIEYDEETKKVSFEAYGKKYTNVDAVRIYKAANASGTTHRPVIKTDWEWGGEKYHGIETSLIDREKMKFKGLVGRNLIKELKLPVHVADGDDLKGEDADKVDLKRKEHEERATA